MPISRPEVGELVKTVVELVDTINAGGGSVDLSAYEGASISLYATDGPVYIASATTVVTLEAEGVDGITLNASGGGLINLQSNSAEGAVTIQATGTNGGINIHAANTLALLADDPSFGQITATAAAGIVIQGTDPFSAILLGTDANTQLVTITNNLIKLDTDSGDGGRIALAPDSVLLDCANDNGQIVLQAGGAVGTINILAASQASIGTDDAVVTADQSTASLTLIADMIGFFNTSAGPKPIVPLTTPSIQNVIDALISIGLLAQSD